MADIFAKKGKSPKPTKLNPAAAMLDKLARGKPKRDPVAKEIERIIGLPLILSVTEEEVEAFCRENQLVESFNAGWRLWPQQVGALLAYDLYDGGFFPVSVGAGKTLISLMVAERAYQNGIERSLLLVPPEVYSQLVNRDITFARQRVPMSVPIMKLGGIKRQKRLAYARSGRQGCYILPYSCLSTKDSSELLEMIQPGLVIADEAHRLKNAGSARTKRMFHRDYGYIIKHQPQMVAMSGTITSKMISDYWQTIRACLKDNCPLPMSSHIVRQWGQVLDAQSEWGGSPQEGDDSFYTEPIMPLVRWAQKNFPDEDFPETIRGFRKAYKKRLNTAPGVVVSDEHEIGTSLLMRNEPGDGTGSEGWDELQKLIEAVKKDFQAPNGDEIDHAIHQFSWLYQLSAGFYNDLYWPAPEVLASERDITVAHAEDLLDRAQHHHMLLQLYHSTLRKWLSRRAKPRLDTPLLVALDMATHGSQHVGPELYDAWNSAKMADFKERPDRRSRPVRVCPYKIVQAADWAQRDVPDGCGAVLWVHHREVGKWLVEELEKRGLDVLHCPAGRKHDEAIGTVGDPVAGGKGDRLVVASISAHSTGKNLQAFSHQFIVQWPRSAVIAEQMMGRLHRSGQEADELVVVTNNTTDSDSLNFAACLNDSCYIHDTTGVRQKLMYASYETPPIVISPAVLKKAGLDPKRLTGEQVQLMRDTFGEMQR